RFDIPSVGCICAHVHFEAGLSRWSPWSYHCRLYVLWCVSKARKGVGETSKRRIYQRRLEFRVNEDGNSLRRTWNKIRRVRHFCREADVGNRWQTYSLAHPETIFALRA